ncbi:cysteine desulfurase family protein [Polyangium aurulentum]|uniref:cysteine desulfurase family protein n=1 Tax=Polyangium aurulentum TaxID=2567896 RepID=UPI0010AEB542|nr:cysteine desulfurase family protein [Polyangium aurulentum]UQA62698.1 cysteine desulfurase [Polyangium aurulentum]
MADDPIYLDHNATTPLLPEVVEAMLPYLREHFGNPSSGHVYGRRAREGVDRARAEVAALLGCSPAEILFTSGGTEANNLAIRGVTEARPERRHVVTSVVEHPATAAFCSWLARHGFRIDRVGVDASGRTRAGDVGAALGEDTALVTIMHANNETGVLQPIGEIAALAHRAGALVHTDAAQSLGKVPVDVNALGVDLLSIAGHKLYAPKGVGALYVRAGTPLTPFLLGAGHERGLRPGTENVASIVGLGVACAAARRDLDTLAARMKNLSDRLFAALSERVPGIALHGHPAERLPNTLNVRFPGVSGTALLAATPEIAASTGSACHDGHEAASAVILAMGVPPAEAVGSVRLTLGRSTTEADVDRAAAALANAWARLRAA